MPPRIPRTARPRARAPLPSPRSPRPRRGRAPDSAVGLVSRERTGVAVDRPGKRSRRGLYVAHVVPERRGLRLLRERALERLPSLVHLSREVVDVSQLVQGGRRGLEVSLGSLEL